MRASRTPEALTDAEFDAALADLLDRESGDGPDGDRTDGGDR